MARTNTIEIIIKGKDQASGPLKGITGSLSKIGKIAAGIALGGIAALGAGVGVIASQAIPAASDLAESLNAVDVVFKDAQDSILDFGKTAAQTVGLSQSEFSQLAAVTGAFLKNVGFDLQGAADETINLTQRASDMASIFNTDVSQALNAIQSGLKGEFNPLEQFGVKINAAAIEARALELGLAKTKKELDDNAKATAALSLIYEQTEQFAGDFANTSGGLANSTKILKSQMQDLKATVGRFLLPIVEKFVGFLSSKAVPALTNIIKLLETGDFTGGIFGLTEDHPLITFLLKARGFAVDFMTLVNVIREFGIESKTAQLALSNMFGGRFVETIFRVKDAISSVFEIGRLLVTGDFRGGIFGMFEDDPFIGALFTVRDTISSIYEIGRLLVTGDFRGGIFGMFEDDPFIESLFNIRDTITSIALRVGELATVFGAFISNVVAPFIAQHGDQLVGVLAGIVAGLAAFSVISTVIGWITGLVAAISAAGTAIGAAGGIIGAIVAILGGPLTIAIAAVAALIGVFTAAWINNWFGIREKTANVINILSNLWNNVLMPALQAIWKFLSVDMLPIWQALGELLGVTVSLVLTALAGLWEKVLLPAIRAVWALIKDNVLPIFNSLWQFIQDRIIPIFQGMSQSIGGVTGAIQTVVGWINTLIEKLRNLSLPDWLTPGSPAPIELVFTGLNESIKELAGVRLPRLETAFSNMQPVPTGPSASMSGFGGGSSTTNVGGTTIIQNFHSEGAAALGLAITRKTSRDRLNASMGR